MRTLGGLYAAVALAAAPLGAQAPPHTWTELEKNETPGHERTSYSYDRANIGAVGAELTIWVRYVIVSPDSGTARGTDTQVYKVVIDCAAHRFHMGTNLTWMDMPLDPKDSWRRLERLACAQNAAH